MTNTPEIQESESPNTGIKEIHETNSQELEKKLASLLKTQKLPTLRDVSEEIYTESDSNSSEESIYDSDYVPPKRKRTSKSIGHFQHNIEAKMYNDNQKLHAKIYKYGIELDRLYTEVNHLNNQIVEYNKCESDIKGLEKYKNEYLKLKAKFEFLQMYNMLYFAIIVVCFADYQFEHKIFPYLYSLFQLGITMLKNYEFLIKY